MLKGGSEINQLINSEFRKQIRPRPWPSHTAAFVWSTTLHLFHCPTENVGSRTSGSNLPPTFSSSNHGNENRTVMLIRFNGLLLLFKRKDIIFLEEKKQKCIIIDKTIPIPLEAGKCYAEKIVSSCFFRVF